MTEDRDSSRLQAAKAAKERAREFRKASYQKAKAMAKERRAALASTPEAAERKAAAKAKRRAAYKKAKELNKQTGQTRQTSAVKRAAKAVTDRADDFTDEHTKREAQNEATAQRQQDLLRLITTADKIAPATPDQSRAKPRLTLVKAESGASPPF